MMEVRLVRSVLSPHDHKIHENVYIYIVSHS